MRFADDFVVCVAGERRHAEALMAETARVLEPLGLTLSGEKTGVTHIDDGFDFLGWRIKRDRGRRGRPGIFLIPSKPSLAAVKSKIKQITRSGTNQSLAQLLHWLNPVLRGWCAYFRSGVSSQTFQYLRHYTWRRCALAAAEVPAAELGLAAAPLPPRRWLAPLCQRHVRRSWPRNY